jgi:hypothetical protein
MSTPDDGRRDVTVDANDAAPDLPSKPDACDPGSAKSPAENACLISEQYGVFVSPQGNDATGLGTRSAPYKTLLKGAQIAKGSRSALRVYVCDDGSGYQDGALIDAALDGISIFGGFECSMWAYSNTRRAKVHPAGGIPLTVKGIMVGLTVEDLELIAPGGTAGASSIASIVDNSANVVFRSVKFIAGRGGDGVDGAVGEPGARGEEPSAQQDGRPGDCSIDAGITQAGGAWTMPGACTSQGGLGGQASRSAGTSGTDGLPQMDVANPGLQNAGKAGMIGEDGKAGSAGEVGKGGVAAPAMAGTFSETGYSIPAAGAGGTGTVAQGGGGGGASTVAFSSGCVGASGGAGGIGGCGGKGGQGGGGGGASVALLLWTSSIALDRCELVSGEGGTGGKGGVGGLGGEGGPGGKGGAEIVADAATSVGNGGNGGKGGQGGQGGPGAGGNGGPSYALVYKGAQPNRTNTSVSRGTGGAKGLGAVVGTNKGADGAPGASLDDLVIPP